MATSNKASPKPSRKKPGGPKAPDDNLILVFKRLATRPIKVTQNGRKRTMTAAQAIIAKNIEEALRGDSAAMANFMRLAEQAGELVDRTNPAVAGRPLIMPRKFSTEELMAYTGSKRVKVPSSKLS